MAGRFCSNTNISHNDKTIRYRKNNVCVCNFMYAGLCLYVVESKRNESQVIGRNRIFIYRKKKLTRKESVLIVIQKELPRKYPRIPKRQYTEETHLPWW